MNPFNDFITPDNIDSNIDSIDEHTGNIDSAPYNLMSTVQIIQDSTDCQTNLEDILINYNDKFKQATSILFRDKVIHQTLATLIGKNKPNALLVGMAGVGKTKIVEEIAHNLANNDPIIPDRLKDHVIYELPLSNIMAGSSLVGQIEEKLKAIIAFASDPNEKCILFIDEIHQIMNGGEQYQKIAQILKPALARGDLKCIGATTTQEITELAKDPAFNRRFSRIIVDELTKEQTVEVLKRAIPNFMNHYNNQLHIDDSLIQTVVEIAEDYHAAGSHRPDTALTLLDSACGDAIIHRKVQEIAASNDPLILQAIKSQPVIRLTEKQIKNTGIRITTGNSKPKELNIDDLRQALSRIKGQDEVIEKVIKKLKQNELGLFPKTKPMTILFTGPSGVGKTEITKIVARQLTGVKPIILNMTEYNNSSTINKIIGSPMGYMGSDSHTEMPFDSLESNPYQIILLDEFEKCANSVKRLFMQAFDEGYIKDNKGRIIDFSKSIIIATTNAGHERHQSPVGFTQDQTKSTTRISELSNHFDIALLNRFNECITFNPIDKEIYKEIIISTYNREYNRIKSNNRHINIPQAIPDEDLSKMIENTYNINFGARPIEHAVREYITEQIV